MTADSAIGATDRIHDPIHRTSYALRREGENLWVETWFEDGAHLPEHFHPTLEEHWEMLAGTTELKLDGHWRCLSPEDGTVRVAPNVRHELRNTAGREAHARTKVLPAGRLEEFLTQSGWAARHGLLSARGIPTSLRSAIWLAAFAQRFRDETVVTSPPPAVQRIVLPVLARFARDPAPADRCPADRVEIEALRAEFVDAVMMHDYDRLASLFTADGVVRMPHVNAVGIGREQIRAGVERMQGLWDCFVQTTHPGTIQLDGDTASGRAYIFELMHGQEHGSNLNHGIYHDRYRRTPDGWKFAERTYQITYVDTTPLPGSAPTPSGPSTQNASQGAAA